MSNAKLEEISFKDEHGEAMVVRFELAGRRFILRSALHVLAVMPTGRVNPDGTPEVNLKTQMIVTTEEVEVPALALVTG